MNEPDRLTLDETAARHTGEAETVRLDARIGREPCVIDVAAEAVEELVGEAPLSPDRLVDSVEAHRVRIAEIARRKAGPRVPPGGVVLVTSRDVPKAGAPASGGGR